MTQIMQSKLARGVYVILDPAISAAPLDLLDATIRAGTRTFQLRQKAGVDRLLLRALLARAHAAGATLIVNDDLDAALEADGWHGGQEDIASLDLAAVRAALGSRLLGISCGTAREARRAHVAGADYVGTGPFAVTATKGDAGNAIGVAGVAAVVAAVPLPIVAIGGIDAANIAAVARSGAHMAAVISAVTRAPDPEAATRALIVAWEAAG